MQQLKFSFGTVSKLYANIKDRTIRKEIGDTLGQYSEIIKSWMRSLTYTRNLCAHHSRLWGSCGRTPKSGRSEFMSNFIP
ncbi:Abi family protein [Legionella nautarum]|uniref:Abi family protein n=1 Tax=Legionella nautarum TaxID=45070 RepID=UPI002415513B|nr:Abi family protein [Legionella nautarum]